jgi:hypothetical protein
VVVGALGDGRCDVAQCVGASQQSGTALEEVTFAATQGATYYLVVDGYDGAVSGYSLEIDCAKQ